MQTHYFVYMFIGYNLSKFNVGLLLFGLMGELSDWLAQAGGSKSGEYNLFILHSEALSLPEAKHILANSSVYFLSIFCC